MWVKWLLIYSIFTSSTQIHRQCPYFKEQGASLMPFHWNRYEVAELFDVIKIHTRNSPRTQVCADRHYEREEKNLQRCHSTCKNYPPPRHSCAWSFYAALMFNQKRRFNMKVPLTCSYVPLFFHHNFFLKSIELICSFSLRYCILMREEEKSFYYSTDAKCELHVNIHHRLLLSSRFVNFCGEKIIAEMPLRRDTVSSLNYSTAAH